MAEFNPLRKTNNNRTTKLKNNQLKLKKLNNLTNLGLTKPNMSNVLSRNQREKQCIPGNFIIFVDEHGIRQVASIINHYRKHKHGEKYITIKFSNNPQSYEILCSDPRLHPLPPIRTTGIRSKKPKRKSKSSRKKSKKQKSSRKKSKKSKRSRRK